MIDPSDLKFSRTHEWVRVKGKKIVVGITEYAQERISDSIGIDLPEPDDTHYSAGDDLGVIESTRSTADFHAPVDGVVVACNSRLLSEPELMNSDPYGAGWIVEMKPDRMADVHDLLDIDEYEATLPESEED